MDYCCVSSRVVSITAVAPMKKTIVKTRLVLRKETTRELLGNQFEQVGAGQGNDGVVTHIGATCVHGATPEQK